MQIQFEDFQKLDIRVGTIISADHFKKAIKPSYQLEIDFGVLGVKKSSAQLTERYLPSTLLGKQIIAIINLPKKQVANFFSECLVLGIYIPNQGVVLLGTDVVINNGAVIG